MRLPFVGNIRAVVVATVFGPALFASVVGCARPPVGPPGGKNPPAPGRVGPIALEQFTQDRPAIGGKWYDYSPDLHVLEPKAEAWIVRAPTPDEDGVRHAAFRIVSVYEPDRAESGLFTFSIALHDGVSWGAESPWATPRNVKDGALCVDLFARAQVDCAEPTWQLRLALQNRFSNLAGIAVAEPAIFLRSVAGIGSFGTVRAARIDGVRDLSSLPAPNDLRELDDAPPDAWDSTDWAFGSLAPDLPEAGMAIGSRFTDDGFIGRDDVSWLMTSRFDLVRFTVVPVEDGNTDAGIRISFSSVAASRDDWSAPESLPDDATVDVPSPTAGNAIFLSFSTADLAPAAEHLEGKAWPFAPPTTTRWDLAVARVHNTLRILVSPAACILNATQLGFDTDSPPLAP